MLEGEGNQEMGQEEVINASCEKPCKAEQPFGPNQTAPCYQEEEEELSQELSSFILGRCPLVDAVKEPGEVKEGTRLSDLEKGEPEVRVFQGFFLGKQISCWIF